MTTRTEHDSLGAIEVPDEKLWGAQTQRSLQNFAISHERIPLPVIHALALVKWAAAKVNAELGLLDDEVARAIEQAAEEVLTGRHDGEFPLKVWQTGSGTQTHMNVNEVLANRASELMGGKRGAERRVHPNDHVNRGQSSNDVFPSAMSIAATRALTEAVVPEGRSLARALRERAAEIGDVVKIGRTHLQDATPVTVQQEMGAWAAQIDSAVDGIEREISPVARLAIGGTAVGTGLNADPRFASRVVAALRERSGLPLQEAPNKFEVISAHDAFVSAHGALRTLGVALTKIANDVRWLGSGPRAGIGELKLPANEPGSSIMPGKVNPTQAEALVMASAQVFGNDVTITHAGAGGAFQLNACKPVIIHGFLQSCRLLSDGARSFRDNCVEGLEVDAARVKTHLDQSLMLVTALTPHIGYDAAQKIAKKAHAEGTSLKRAALALDLVSEEDFDRWVRPEEMVGPAE